MVIIVQLNADETRAWLENPNHSRGLYQPIAERLAREHYCEVRIRGTGSPSVRRRYGFPWVTVSAKGKFRIE